VNDVGIEPTTSAFARLWPHILNPSGGFCPHGIDKLLNHERAFGILEAQHIRPLKIGIGRMTHNGSVHVINEDVGISMKLLTARLFEILTHFLLACAFNKFAALSTNVTRCFLLSPPPLGASDHNTDKKMGAPIINNGQRFKAILFICLLRFHNASSDIANTGPSHLP